MKEAKKETTERLLEEGSFIHRRKRDNGSWWLCPSWHLEIHEVRLSQSKTKGRPTLLSWVFVEIIYGEGTGQKLSEHFSGTNPGSWLSHKIDAILL